MGADEFGAYLGELEIATSTHLDDLRVDLPEELNRCIASDG